MAPRHAKYKRGSLVLLRQLDAAGKVVTTWGGRVRSATAGKLSVLAIEMVLQGESWHAVGEFQVVEAPPHRLPYKWDFPRLLVKTEANDVDLKAAPVIEVALRIHEQKA